MYSWSKLSLRLFRIIRQYYNTFEFKNEKSGRLSNIDSKVNLVMELYRRIYYMPILILF